MIFLHPFLKFVMMWCCKHSVCLHLHSFGLEDDCKSLMDNFMMPLLQKEWASWLHIMLPWSLLVLCVCVWVVLQRGTGVQFPSSFKYSPNQSHANCSLLVAVHMSPLSKYIWTTNTLKGNANMRVFFIYNEWNTSSTQKVSHKHFHTKHINNISTPTSTHFPMIRVSATVGLEDIPAVRGFKGRVRPEKTASLLQG